MFLTILEDGGKITRLWSELTTRTHHIKLPWQKESNLNSCENCEPLQRTHLQRPLLKMSPTAGDETSRGRNLENGRVRDFGRRRRHRQSGFQHTDRPRPSSPELFNKDLKQLLDKRSMKLVILYLLRN